MSKSEDTISGKIIVKYSDAFYGMAPSGDKVVLIAVDYVDGTQDVLAFDPAIAHAVGHVLLAVPKSL
jgi:hypothetical protein